MNGQINKEEETMNDTPNFTDEYADKIEAVLRANGVEVKKRMTHPIHTLTHWTDGQGDEDNVPVMARSFKTKKSAVLDDVVDYVKTNDIKVVALYQVIGRSVATVDMHKIDAVTFQPGPKLTPEEVADHNDELIVRGYFGAKMPEQSDVSERFIVQSNHDFQG